ncbi:mas-related G-protein coupled receptor member X1-like [Betta splendens]|uniref:Mas-related G-protein coupled receptor member X1-like n=1 Tax=Betta splendens TaxID=158456 RepID=A0A8M1H8I9_BETSP|nr:mas-related G-protein coupled receptor member X1-like [Betta splendens]XP_040924755.1 mas-related G-protein coupled receptor member X1-like [Betta splendens]
MNQSNINDTMMDTADNIYEVYNGTEVAITYDGERWLYDNILKVSTWLMFTIGLVLTPIAIFAVSSLVKKDNVAPIFVINLLVSDVIQLCSMIIVLTGQETVTIIGECMYVFGVSASVYFMLCIALERYLVIVWPLWYRTRRTVKMSLLLCAAVWTLALVFAFFDKWDASIQGKLHHTISCVLLLLPFPLLVFFLVGTLRALSASISVRAEEKRRIVGLLVLVLLIYTLLFLPLIIFNFLPDDKRKFVAVLFIELNPIADFFMYIFLRKEAVNQVWFCLCCCRKNRTSRQSSSGLNDCDTVTGL